MTTSRPTCGAALVMIERPGMKPCAASCTGIFARMLSSTQYCARFSRGMGAEMWRSPPLFLGMVKRW